MHGTIFAEGKRVVSAQTHRGSGTRQIAISPEDRQAPELNCAVVQVRLDPLRAERPQRPVIRAMAAKNIGEFIAQAYQIGIFHSA